MVQDMLGGLNTLCFNGVWRFLVVWPRFVGAINFFVDAVKWRRWWRGAYGSDGEICTRQWNFFDIRERGYLVVDTRYNHDLIFSWPLFFWIPTVDFARNRAFLEDHRVL